MIPGQCQWYFRTESNCRIFEPWLAWSGHFWGIVELATVASHHFPRHLIISIISLIEKQFGHVIWVKQICDI